MPSVRWRIAAAVGPEVVAAAVIIALAIVILVLLMLGSPGATSPTGTPVPTSSAGFTR